MGEFLIVTMTAIVPLAITIYALVLLKQIADGVSRTEATIERRLLRIERALGADTGDDRWPRES